jgi:hypothetical protein
MDFSLPRCGKGEIDVGPTLSYQLVRYCALLYSDIRGSGLHSSLTYLVDNFCFEEIVTLTRPD